MKVSELITYLQQQPPDHEVLFDCIDFEDYFDLQGISVMNTLVGNTPNTERENSCFVPLCDSNGEPYPTDKTAGYTDVRGAIVIRGEDI